MYHWWTCTWAMNPSNRSSPRISDIHSGCLMDVLQCFAVNEENPVRAWMSCSVLQLMRRTLYWHPQLSSHQFFLRQPTLSNHSWQIQQSSKDVLTKQSIRVQVMESRRQVRFWGCLWKTSAGFQMFPTGSPSFFSFHGDDIFRSWRMTRVDRLFRRRQSFCAALISLWHHPGVLKLVPCLGASLAGHQLYSRSFLARLIWI